MAKTVQVTRLDPFASALSLRDAMDRLFAESFVSPRGLLSSDMFAGALAALPIDMYETQDEVVVTAVLPGLKSEDVNIQFEDGRLIVDANLPAPKVENATWYYRELPSGSYHREITLPIAVDTNKVEATLQNGLLTLQLPKAEAVKPKKIQVKTVAK